VEADEGVLEGKECPLTTIIAALTIGSAASVIDAAIQEVRESYTRLKALILRKFAQQELADLLRLVSLHQRNVLHLQEWITPPQRLDARIILENQLEAELAALDLCILELVAALRAAAVDEDAEVRHQTHALLGLLREQGVELEVQQQVEGLRGKLVAAEIPGMTEGTIEVDHEMTTVAEGGEATGIRIEKLGGGSVKPDEKASPVDSGGVTTGDVTGGIHGSVIAGRDVSALTAFPGIPATTRRYSDVSFPSHACVGQTEALRVAITLEPTTEQGIELTLDLSELMEVDVLVVISPADFDLRSPIVQTIEVPLDTNSAPVIFKLVPKTVGRKTIAVEFFQNTRYLGRAEVEATVGKERRESRTVSAHSALVLRPRQSAPDLTIYIEEIPLRKEWRLYRFLLLSPIHELDLNFEEADGIELQTAPEVYFEEIFAELNEWLQGSDADEAVFFKRLNSLGANLYDQLFPEKLKRIYWEKLRDQVETVQIISVDPWIPWELVRPYHPDALEEDDFLCEQFALTRWLAGKSSPDVIDFQKLALVVAASDLPSTVEEAEALRRLPGVQVQDIPPSLLDVYDLLETGGFNCLHFACHGEYDRRNPDQSAVLLEGGQRFRPNDIAGKKRTFGRDEPLIFLNACETGRAGFALTGLGGWARAFIGAGAGGFVGSIWEAHDESAYKFAVAFYGHLLEGKTVAEAAKLARRSIRRAGDPTWLSYTVYANPLARLATRTAAQA